LHVLLSSLVYLSLCFWYYHSKV